MIGFGGFGQPGVLLAVACGGALGAVARFLLSQFIARAEAEADAPFHAVAGGFPLGTFAVNALGCLLIGIVVGLLMQRGTAQGVWLLVSVTGFLGAFTTFSTFSLEAISLLQAGRLVSAVCYVGASLMICLVATWLGLRVTGAQLG